MFVSLESILGIGTSYFASIEINVFRELNCEVIVALSITLSDGASRKKKM